MTFYATADAIKAIWVVCGGSALILGIYMVSIHDYARTQTKGAMTTKDKRLFMALGGGVVLSLLVAVILTVQQSL